MSASSTDLIARFHSRIDEIDAARWNALRPDDNPFVSHAFLHALERTGCLRADYGWRPHHLALYEGESLVAAAPLYLKGNSHGEFVFDWSWASAWERAGGQYYPKLLNAVPYSPVSGPRLLAGSGSHAALLQQALTGAMRSEVARLGLSSAHANFLQPPEPDAFGEPWLSRSDIQFHWHNRKYRHFPDFLAALSHKKRKNILRERAQVVASGLVLEWRAGHTLDPQEWKQIHALYEATFDAKGNHAALTLGFFKGLGDMGQTSQLAIAKSGDTIVAMALFLRSAKVLYGRYWGASVDVPGLHFELCYYRGIDYAISENLSHFEPG
ncbi:MAG: GNAT family N-acetyltransferase, partial [Pseudomonadota bacterium]|nr:GNAT family N-acetyltransferase [Pseudomonadota bacterium]